MLALHCYQIIVAMIVTIHSARNAKSTIKGAIKGVQSEAQIASPTLKTTKVDKQCLAVIT